MGRVADVELAGLVDLMRASPKLSGPEPFRLPEVVICCPFVFSFICFNASLSDCSPFLPFFLFKLANTGLSGKAF